MTGRHLAIIFSLCLMPAVAQAAGLLSIDLPADADGPAMHGAVWYPCAASHELSQDTAALSDGKDCRVSTGRLPLVVVSHGRGGDEAGHRDTAEALANAGFVVAAINHPADTAADMNRSDDLSALVERPADIRRLIDFMLGRSSLATRIDAGRIGFFGFSRGGYTGLVLLGGNPDWASTAELCRQSASHMCQQILAAAYPKQALAHDSRIKAAVIADPLAVMFTATSFSAVRVPVQLWQSERGGDGVSPESVALVNRTLPLQHEYHLVPNAAHFAFLTPCTPSLTAKRPELCIDAPGFDRAAFHQRFNADVVTFFQTNLPKQR